MSGLEARFVVHRSDAFALDLELDIAAGETVALLGPNGAGKSTAVEVLAGLVGIDEGRVVLDGRVLDDPGAGTFVEPDKRRVGVVFQDYLLFDHLSVMDNVMFGLRASGTSKRDARSAAGGWLERLDLSGLADRRPAELSGGQAQRVALARALATAPDLLLLDEALAALDVTSRGSMRRLLSEHLGAFAGARLLITHDPADAFLLADRVAILEAGTITQVGSGEDIRRRPATAYVADLAGTNLLTGTCTRGSLALDHHPLVLQAADRKTNGAVVITIHPTAVSLHLEEPSGSPRNSWHTVVDTVEPLGDTARITLGLPLPLGVDITAGSVDALGLQPGSLVWASVKATEVLINPTNGTAG